MKSRPVVSQSKAYEGFTLIELMIVVVIAAIVLGIGVPSFRSLIQSQQLTTATNDLFAAIHLSRSEAIKRGLLVHMVPVDDAGDWAQGWSVLVDQNNDHRPDADDELIFSHGPVADGITIKSNFQGGAAQHIAYNATGHTQSGSFSFIQDDQARRKVKINFIGRPRVCNPVTDASTC